MTVYLACVLFTLLAVAGRCSLRHKAKEYESRDTRDERATAMLTIKLVVLFCFELVSLQDIVCHKLHLLLIGYCPVSMETAFFSGWLRCHSV